MNKQDRFQRNKLLQISNFGIRVFFIGDLLQPRINTKEYTRDKVYLEFNRSLFTTLEKSYKLSPNNL